MVYNGKNDCTANIETTNFVSGPLRLLLTKFFTIYGTHKDELNIITPIELNTKKFWNITNVNDAI